MARAISESRKTWLRAAVVVCALTSCAKPPTVGDRDITGEPVPVSQFWEIPRGVDVSAEDFGRNVLGGIYAASRAHDPTCCWMAPEARIRFRKAPAATRLTMRIYVEPAIPLYRRKRPFIRVALDGVTLVSKEALPLGVTVLSMRLPDRYRGGVGPYVLDVSSSSFVPVEQHMSDDSRVLGLILRNLETQ